MAGQDVAELRMWTIYENPSDYPSRFVVRGYTVAGSGGYADVLPLAVVDTLEAARRWIPPQADYCQPRAAEDDPCIVETWL